MNIEGKVIDVDEEILKFSGAYSGSPKVISGSTLKLETCGGTVDIDFPRTISIGDQHDLLNQTVRYCHSNKDSGSGTETLYAEEHILEVLSGRLKGLKITKTVTY